MKNKIDSEWLFARIGGIEESIFLIDKRLEKIEQKEEDRDDGKIPG